MMMLNLKLHEYAFEFLKVDLAVQPDAKNMLIILKNLA